MRKHIRLTGYDYSQNGAYFITFCVKDRQEILGKVVPHNDSGELFVDLSACGDVVRKEIEDTHTYYSGITVEKYCIMPNHVHLIVVISMDDTVSTATNAANALIPRVVTMIKKKTNKAAGFDIWQSSFHDRIIRDEAEYLGIWQYIDSNPSLWADDVYFEQKQ